MSNTYTVKLDAFEGPLELLLELIEKNKLDISDISLAQIANTFISHMEDIEEKDPGYLTSFLVVAAKLILIKSKTLLPSFEISNQEEQEIGELKEKLLQYKKIRDRAKDIEILEKKQHILYHRQSKLKDISTFFPPAKVTVQTLLQMYTIVKNINSTPEAQPKKRIQPFPSFQESLQKIKERVEDCVKLSFHEAHDAKSKADVIVSFLAILELIRQKFLFASQDKAFGEIELTHSP